LGENGRFANRNFPLTQSKDMPHNQANFPRRITMAWIKIIQEHEATGKLKEAYNKLLEPWGGVDNILKIHSLNLRSLWAHFELYKTVMHGRSGLSRAQREMIAVVVSAINRCHY